MFYIYYIIYILCFIYIILYIYILYYIYVCFYLYIMPCSCIDIRHTHMHIAWWSLFSWPSWPRAEKPPTNMGCWFQTYPTYSDRTWLEYDEWWMVCLKIWCPQVQSIIFIYFLIIPMKMVLSVSNNSLPGLRLKKTLTIINLWGMMVMFSCAPSKRNKLIIWIISVPIGI